MAAPRLIFVAGPNGAGKTTFYETFLRGSGLPFVNADRIAAALGVSSPEAAQLADAARVQRATTGPKTKPKPKPPPPMPKPPDLPKFWYARLPLPLHPPIRLPPHPPLHRPNRRPPLPPIQSQSFLWILSSANSCSS
jgi:hypothetical protein